MRVNIYPCNLFCIILCFKFRFHVLHFLHGVLIVVCKSKTDVKYQEKMETFTSLPLCLITPPCRTHSPNLHLFIYLQDLYKEKTNTVRRVKQQSEAPIDPSTVFFFEKTLKFVITGNHVESWQLFPGPWNSFLQCETKIEFELNLTLSQNRRNIFLSPNIELTR